MSLLLLIVSFVASAPSSRAEIDKLIQQLGSESFKEREAASRALEAIGEPAFEAAKKASETSDDAEIRRRARGVMAFIEALPVLKTEEKAIAAIKQAGGMVFRNGPVEVNLDGDQVTDKLLKQLKHIRHLDSLWISDARITDAGLKEIKDLSGVTKLCLSNTRMTDTGIKDLKRLHFLRELYLDGTQVTDAGVKELTGLRYLAMVDVRGSRVTFLGVEQLKREFPQAKILQ